jgi:hypothetical protein
VNAAIVHSFDEPPRYARGGHGYELFSSRRNRSTTSVRNPATSRVRFIQIGSSAGAKISLPAEALRSSGPELIGSVSIERILQSVQEFLTEASTHPFQFKVNAVPLRDVESSWNSRERLVFQP